MTHNQYVGANRVFALSRHKLEANANRATTRVAPTVVGQ
jgi:hypothetical protein